MFTSIIGSIMNMKCDVYMQQNEQTSSGAIERRWVYLDTIGCKIEPLKTGNSMGRADNKQFGDSGKYEYHENLQLKMKSSKPVSRRYRITAIRSNDGQSPYIEIDRYGNPDMIFEVTSSHAELDPLGKISHYETTLSRVPVQDNDTVNR